MTWTYPKHLRNLLPDVQALDARFVSEFGSDTGFAFRSKSQAIRATLVNRGKQ